MSEPWFIPDTKQVSNCCGAPFVTEVIDGDGICSKCKEHAEPEQLEEDE